MAIVGDIGNFTPNQQVKNNTMRENANVLTMNDFLKLMAVQMSNQDMSNPMSESEFMTQMVQMATVQAMTTFTDVATTTYAASLVGKEVTVAEIVDGEIKEVVGTVTAAGLYGGEQVIFVDGKSYKLTSLMAVGKLPEKTEPPDPTDPTDPPEVDNKPPDPPGVDNKPPDPPPDPPSDGGGDSGGDESGSGSEE